ncbi:transposase [Solibacillus cecembensis]|uniref:transposase n=1 Tax=Solibacillus cecembensis TaxID=459347 RepID=UPI003D072C4B
MRTHQPIALLNGRNVEIVSEWLKKQPTLHVIARDGYVLYKAAITSASPSVVQVSDRFHLIQNVFKTMKDVLTRLLPASIEMYKDKPEIVDTSKTLLTPKEEERWELIQEVQKAYKEGTTQIQLAREYRLSQETVRAYVEATQPISFHREKRVSKLIQPFYQYVKEQMALGKFATVIFREIQKHGFTGSYATVKQTVGRLRPQKDPPLFETKKISRRKIIYCFWRHNEKLTKQDHLILQAILKAYPETQPVYAFPQLIRAAFSDIDFQTFLQLIQRFKLENIREIQRFIMTVEADIEAVKESFLYTFNTSIVEGQINRLKLIKRMMYGRASIELLEKRVLFKG